jgi:hypothetical protein
MFFRESVRLNEEQIAAILSGKRLPRSWGRVPRTRFWSYFAPLAERDGRARATDTESES